MQNSYPTNNKCPQCGQVNTPTHICWSDGWPTDERPKAPPVVASPAVPTFGDRVKPPPLPDLPPAEPFRARRDSNGEQMESLGAPVPEPALPPVPTVEEKIEEKPARIRQRGVKVSRSFSASKLLWDRIDAYGKKYRLANRMEAMQDLLERALEADVADAGSPE